MQHSSIQNLGGIDYNELSTTTTDRLVPIGSLSQWCKNFPGVPALPAGWLECDGSVISDPESPMDGETLPNLTTNGFVLTGSTSSGSVSVLPTGHSGVGNHFCGYVYGTSTWKHFYEDGGNSILLSNTNSTPSNFHETYSVVIIMRIK